MMLMNTESRSYKSIAATTIITLVSQAFNWAFVSALFIFGPSPFDMAWAQTYEDLREVYETDDPYNNYNGTDLRDEVLQKNYAPSDKNYEQYIKEKYYSQPPAESEPIDLSKYYDDDHSFDDDFNDGVGYANEAASNVTLPSVGEGGDTIAIDYHTEGAYIPVRDENGDYQFEANSEESGDVDDLALNEAASAELEHEDTNVDAAGNYGNQAGFQHTASNELDYQAVGTTSNAIAYQTVIDAFNQNPPQKIDPDDPFFDETKKNLDDARDGTGDWYQDCETRIIEEEKQIHYPLWEESQCSAPNLENLYSCVVRRESNFPVKVIDYSGDLFEYDIRYVNDKTVKISVGRYADNWLPSAGGHLCKVHSSRIVFGVDEGYSIIKATRSSVLVDDSLRMFVNGEEVAYRAKHTTDQSNFYWSITPDESLDLSRSRYTDMPMDYHRYEEYIKGTKNDSGAITCEHHQGNLYGESDLTPYVQNLENGELPIEYLIGVGGLGDIYFEITLKFDKVIDTSSIVYQDPPGCADAIGWQQEGNPEYCSADNPLCQKPYTAEGSFCKADDWTCVDSGKKGWSQSVLDTMSPLYPGDNHNVCWAANADNYICDPLDGYQYCITDHDGTQTCYSYEDIRNVPDQCGEYKADPLCYEKERQCAEGWYDESSERCYMWNMIYECDIGPTETKKETREVNTCDGGLPCVGGDCSTGPGENSGKFEEAMAYLDMLSYMGGDTNCENPTDPETCTVFNGERKYCSWESTGIGPNCCEKPTGLNIFEYLAIADMMMDMGEYVEIPYFDDATKYVDGKWTELKNSISTGFEDAWNTISDPITSSLESLFGETTAPAGSGKAAGPIDDAIAETSLVTFEQQMMEYSYNTLNDIFGPEAADAFFTEVKVPGGKATYKFSPMMETAMTYMHYISMAYMVYAMIKLLLNILFACEEEEMDMGVRIHTKQCFKVEGSYCVKEFLGLCLQKRQDYCCYSSAMSRIIMEQAYPLLDKDTSECRGMTPSEMEELDWDQISMDEWVAMMSAAGTMPTEEELMSPTNPVNPNNPNPVVSDPGVPTNPTNPVMPSILSVDESKTPHEYINDLRMPNVGRRLDSNEEIEFMLDDTDWTERADELRKGLSPYDVNCSSWPRPPACDLGVPPTGK